VGAWEENKATCISFHGHWGRRLVRGGTQAIRWGRAPSGPIAGYSHVSPHECEECLFGAALFD